MSIVQRLDRLERATPPAVVRRTVFVSPGGYPAEAEAAFRAADEANDWAMVQALAAEHEGIELGPEAETFLIAAYRHDGNPARPLCEGRYAR